MTTLEALVSMSQTLLRVRGEWTMPAVTDEITVNVLKADIRRAVEGVSRMIRYEHDGDNVRCERMAVAEIERRGIIWR